MEGLLLKYFVLNPNKKDEYGKASRFAIIIYARSIQYENPELANDLEKWIEDIEDNLF